MGTGTTPGRWPLSTLLRVSLLVLVALVALKFLVLLAENGWRVSDAPLPLLVVVAVPGLALAWLVTRAPRPTAAIAALVMLAFIAVVVAALARDGLARESWADYPFAYGGLVVAVVGLAAAVGLLRRGRSGAA